MGGGRLTGIAPSNRNCPRPIGIAPSNRNCPRPIGIAPAHTPASPHHAPQLLTPDLARFKLLTWLNQAFIREAAGLKPLTKMGRLLASNYVQAFPDYIAVDAPAGGGPPAVILMTVVVVILTTVVVMVSRLLPPILHRLQFNHKHFGKIG